MARKKETVEDKAVRPESASTKGTLKRCNCTAKLSTDPSAHAPNCPARIDLKGN